MENIHLAFGNYLQKLRKKKQLTQLQLAEKSGLSLKHLGEIERGRGNPSLESLNSLAESLDVTLPELFSFQVQEVSRKEDASSKLIESIKATSSKNTVILMNILKELENYNE
ncbi:helix-turn-helix domain-containing protein [Solidesulfovibrio fructosivorans]|uniref:helix-turn-helix domain-containing protein n=1 Tax=Solidesulfovibrio fructosivorans TaxID=878 RepID=UPI0009D6E43B|nr:helix-turn-helix transcriptional regulator [Solidesulfovibrio fructosivorans]